MSEKENNLVKTGDQVDLSKYVDGEGGIFSVRQLENIRGWNNIQYGAGLSENNPGRRGGPSPHPCGLRSDDLPIARECPSRIRFGMQEIGYS